MNWRILYVLVLIPILIFCIFLYSYYIERHHIVIERITIPSKKISSEIKIVQISDIHLAALSDYEKKVVQMVNDQKPDIIAITGDFFRQSELFENPEAEKFQKILNDLAEIVATMKSKYGIFICRGNNDFSNDKENSDYFVEKMRAIGAHVLTNQVQKIKVADQEIYILGTDFSEFEKTDVVDFFVHDKGNKFFESGNSLKNSYSHYYTLQNWKNYTYFGKFRLSQPQKGGIGFTFYSQFLNGLDKYYRLRRTKNSDFYFSPHGTTVNDNSETIAIQLDPQKWYSFKIDVNSLINKTVMKAKIWESNTPEPATWMVKAYDDSPDRLQSGTVGLWSSKESDHCFDDLVVVSETGDTLAFENFENTPNGADPENWLDYNYSHHSFALFAEQVDDNKLSILLGHSPDIVIEAEKHNIDIVLSGHTHGGQINLPIIGPILVRIAIGRKYTQGLHYFNNTALYITRGIGTVLFPLRFLCPPEISVITISPKNKN